MCCFVGGVASPGTLTVQSQGLGTQVTQSLTRTIVSAPIMTTTTTAASQEAAAAVEAMEAESAEAIEGLPMQVGAELSLGTQQGRSDCCGVGVEQLHQKFQTSTVDAVNMSTLLIQVDGTFDDGMLIQLDGTEDGEGEQQEQVAGEQQEGELQPEEDGAEAGIEGLADPGGDVGVGLAEGADQLPLIDPTADPSAAGTLQGNNPRLRGTVLFHAPYLEDCMTLHEGSTNENCD